MVERHADTPNILRLNPPERPQRPDLRKTGLIWSNLKDSTKEAVWQTLWFKFVLPDAFQWVLHDAMMVDPGPSLLTRGLIRLLPRLEYKKVNKDSYIIVFVPTNSTQSRPDPFGQVDVADHGMSGGPPVPAGAIPGPYSLQSHRLQYRPETAIPSQEHQSPPFYAGERRFSWQSTTSPAFAQPAPGLRADRIPLDQMRSDRIPTNRLPTDRMPVNRMPADRMLINRTLEDRMQLDPMPSYRIPRRRYSTSPPNNPNRGYQQRVPRSLDVYPPDRNGYPPLSEERRPGALHSRTSARLPSRVRRSELPDSDQRRPAVSSATTGLFDRAYYPPLHGSKQSWAELVSSDDGRSGYDIPVGLPRGEREYVVAPRRPRSARSEATDSSDQSDDSLDDDELYDQLLRKFTGHGLRERETANENDDGRVEGRDDEEGRATVRRNGNADPNGFSDADSNDKIADGDADGKDIGSDDKSDDQNQELHR